MIERIDSPKGKLIKGYHTQEYRPTELKTPILCNEDEAWLGEGYYFWVEEEFAKYWGEDKKSKATGAYSIYSAWIEEGYILNTTFNEGHYFYFKECIDKAIQNSKEQGEEIKIKDIHQYLKDEFWGHIGITGIMYDDLPQNVERKNRKGRLIRKRIYSEIRPLFYNKRIQIVVFSEDDYKDFHLHL